MQKAIGQQAATKEKKISAGRRPTRSEMAGTAKPQMTQATPMQLMTALIVPGSKPLALTR
jgi:hypothetical protein